MGTPEIWRARQTQFEKLAEADGGWLRGSLCAPDLEKFAAEQRALAQKLTDEARGVKPAVIDDFLDQADRASRLAADPSYDHRGEWEVVDERKRDTCPPGEAVARFKLCAFGAARDAGLVGADSPIETGLQEWLHLIAANDLERVHAKVEDGWGTIKNLHAASALLCQSFVESARILPAVRRGEASTTPSPGLERVSTEQEKLIEAFLTRVGRAKGHRPPETYIWRDCALFGDQSVYLRWKAGKIPLRSGKGAQRILKVFKMSDDDLPPIAPLRPSR